MQMVQADVESVEVRLRAGEIACVGCGGELRPWGYARWRTSLTMLDAVDAAEELGMPGAMRRGSGALLACGRSARWIATEEWAGSFSCSSPTGGLGCGWTMNAIDSTAGRPADCMFYGSRDVFWVANDASNRIYFKIGRPGPGGATINDVDSTLEPPAVCVFQDRIHLL